VAPLGKKGEEAHLLFDGLLAWSFFILFFTGAYANIHAHTHKKTIYNVT